MQVNTQTYVEVRIAAEQLSDDDASIGGVLLKLTEREARQLAKDLADAARKKR